MIKYDTSKIDKGIKVPTRRQSGVTSLAKQMEIGDSYLVPNGPKVSREAWKLFAAINRIHGKGSATTCSEKGVGIRVWRIKSTNKKGKESGEARLAPAPEETPQSQVPKEETLARESQPVEQGPTPFAQGPAPKEPQKPAEPAPQPPEPAPAPAPEEPQTG